MKVLLSLCSLMFLAMCTGEVDTNSKRLETTVIDRRFDDENFNISFIANDKSATFQCLVELTGGNNSHTDKEWKACSSPTSIRMAGGQNLRLQIRAVSARGAVSQPVLVTETYEPTATTGGSSHYEIVAPPFLQVGSAFFFAVPRGMHLTQYATTSTYHGANTVEFMHLQHGQNYNYTGSMILHHAGNGCGIATQDIIRMSNSTGNAYNYCRASVNTSDFFNLLRGSYARNHIEVASNDLITEEGANRQMPRLLVQVFGAAESQMIRSRFDELCQPSNRLGAIRPFSNIKMVQGFWHSDELRVANTYVCTAQLGGLNGGIYKIGGFTAIAEVGANMGISYGKYLSVIYMERVHNENGIDELFARNFQTVLLSSLRKSRP